MPHHRLRATLARYIPHGTLAGAAAAALILFMLAGASLTQTGCETVTACLSAPYEPEPVDMGEDVSESDASEDASASVGRDALLEKFAGRLPGDVLARLEKA